MSVDFTRHIVNPVLSKVIDVRKSEHVKILDEIRKIIHDCEEKYGFSIYGGDVEKLAEFLMSDDFNNLVKVFDTYGLRNALVKILEEALEAYRDYVEVSKALESRISMLKNNKAGSHGKNNRGRSIGELITLLKSKYPNMESDPDRKEVRVELGEGRFAKIKFYRKKIVVNMVIELKEDDPSLLSRDLQSILECPSSR
ncbi:hypothetical protein IMZ38_03295 [Thermosphaera chiliense]|uniref:Uncharacterized protein n=1 Tax=Thermosphaera chiliense TaxID=3402707 RepID=A0A7M1UUY3_9CREN|nr:hypothetical protein [Thermosphaera aggregans]QOR94944.1 hypothetical protein IMZ38_03295 [Thermosphaera aggregans]